MKQQVDKMFLHLAKTLASCEHS